MNNVWYAYLGWVIAAGLLGFAISFIFAGVVRHPHGIGVCTCLLWIGDLALSF